MKSLTAILLFSLMAISVGRTQPTITREATATSRSGQFAVSGISPDTFRPYVAAVATNTALVSLEPTLLAISCERIKRALLTTLDAPDQWRGKIYFFLHPARQPNEEIVVTSYRFNNNWNYRIDLPDRVSATRLVRAVTETLLVEMANRNRPPHPATLPRWVSVGLPAYLELNSDMAFILQPAPEMGHQRMDLRERTGPWLDPLGPSRELFGQSPPLNINALGQPAAALPDVSPETFRANAVLFVHELLQLPHGGADLAAMLPELSWDPDWRVAFLHTYHDHFPRLVDLEKWWALQTVYLADRNADRTWPRDLTLQKLDAALRCSLEVKIDSNAPPFFTDVSLQRVFQEWQYPQQQRLLQDKLELLAAIRLRANAELTGLVDQYHQVLKTYLEKINAAANPPAPTFVFGRQPQVKRKQKPFVLTPDNPAVQEARAQLDVLDQRRIEWELLAKKTP